jgi:uncharacterized membrane protein
MPAGRARRIPSFLEWGPRNVGQTERWVTGLAGVVLATYGISRRSRGGALVAALASAMVYRAATAHCPVYSLAGKGTASAPRESARALSAQRGINVEDAITVNRPVAEVYAFWRDVENLGRFLRHVESVRALDRIRSRWTVRGPMGVRVGWDAEIISDEPGRVIGWQSVDNSPVVHAGAVTFRPSPDGRATDIRVLLQYSPPGGKIGAALASLFGHDPSQEIREDLARLKDLLEVGPLS